jgi:hypothetical protein
MKTTVTAAVAVAVALVSVPVRAQALVDAAKRAEDSRKANTATPVTFDERDVNPTVAARELLDYAINEERWQKFVAADSKIMTVMEKDSALYSRLEMLRANSARMIERFLAREAALLKVLNAAGTDPHEYAYTSVAIGVAMAFIANDPGPTVMEQLPDATKTNIAFVRAHDAEIKELLQRGQQLQDMMSKRGQ